MMQTRFGTVLVLSAVAMVGCAHDKKKRHAEPATAPAGQVASVITPVVPVEGTRAGARATTRPVGRSGSLVRRKSEPKRAERNEYVDKLVLIDTPAGFNDATLRHVAIERGEAARIVLDEPDNAEYPRTGTWTSEETPTKFGFTELIPSWNVTAPAQTGARLFVRTKDVASGEWSPWLYIGQWGKTSPADERVTKFDGGRVDVDSLILDRPASAWQVKAVLESFETNVSVNPSIRRIGVVCSGVVEDAKKREELLEKHEAPSQWAVNLPVPFLAQGDNPKALRGQTCSPTSTSMVMAYWGATKPTVENCLAIWDAENGMFGNWGRAVARAGELGLDSWIARYRNWDEVKAELAKGQPVIASIRFGKGEYPSFIYDGTAGHLLVIRGMTPGGDPICNDPASRSFGKAVVYKAEDLGRAWFGNGGVAYVIHGSKPLGPAVASKMPTTRQTDKKVVMGIDGDGLPE